MKNEKSMTFYLVITLMQLIIVICINLILFLKGYTISGMIGLVLMTIIEIKAYLILGVFTK